MNVKNRSLHLDTMQSYSAGVSVITIFILPGDTEIFFVVNVFFVCLFVLLYKNKSTYLIF